MTDGRDVQGIYVRIGYPDCEVFWMDGQAIIERAYDEEHQTGDAISDYLLLGSSVINYHHEMYDEYGVYLGKKELRSITVLEAVRFLGRFLNICRFLTLKEDAERFVKLLESGDDKTELEAAKKIRVLIPRLPSRVSHKQTPHFTTRTSSLVSIK